MAGARGWGGGIVTVGILVSICFAQVWKKEAETTKRAAVSKLHQPWNH